MSQMRKNSEPVALKKKQRKQKGTKPQTRTSGSVKSSEVWGDSHVLKQNPSGRADGPLRAAKEIAELKRRQNEHLLLLLEEEKEAENARQDMLKSLKEPAEIKRLESVFQYVDLFSF